MVETAVELPGDVDETAGGGGEEAVLLIDYRHGAGEGRVAHGEAGQLIQVGGAGDAALLQEGEALIFHNQINGGGIVGGNEDVLRLHVVDGEGIMEQLGQPPVLGQQEHPHCNDAPPCKAWETDVAIQQARCLDIRIAPCQERVHDHLAGH